MALIKVITSLTNLFTAGRQFNRTQQQNSTLKRNTKTDTTTDGKDGNDGNHGNDGNGDKQQLRKIRL